MGVEVWRWVCIASEIFSWWCWWRSWKYGGSGGGFALHLRCGGREDEDVDLTWCFPDYYISWIIRYFSLVVMMVDRGCVVVVVVGANQMIKIWWCWRMWWWRFGVSGGGCCIANQKRLWDIKKQKVLLKLKRLTNIYRLNTNHQGWQEKHRHCLDVSGSHFPHIIASGGKSGYLLPLLGTHEHYNALNLATLSLFMSWQSSLESQFVRSAWKESKYGAGRGRGSIGERGWNHSRPVFVFISCHF